MWNEEFLPLKDVSLYEESKMKSKNELVLMIYFLFDLTILVDILLLFDFWQSK